MALALAKSRKGLGGSGDQSVVESLRELSYNCACFHVPSEHDGECILHVARLDAPRKLGPHGGGARATLRAAARSAGSSLLPNPAEKTRIRTSSGAEVGYLKGTFLYKKVPLVIWGRFGGK